MSSWSVIRKATADDVAAVNRAAERFAARHGIDTSIRGAVSAVESATTVYRDMTPAALDRARRLYKLWRAVLTRAVGSPDGIAYGTVGRSVP